MRIRDENIPYHYQLPSIELSTNNLFQIIIRTVYRNCQSSNVKDKGISIIDN